MISAANCPGRSISRRLSTKLATVIFVALGITSGCVYWALSARVQELQQDSLSEKQQVLANVLTLSATKGETAVVDKLEMIAPMRGGVRTEVKRTDGSVLFSDPDKPPFVLSAHRLPVQFEVASPTSPGGKLIVHAAMDIGQDTRMLRGFALTLFGVTLISAVCVGGLVLWRVRRELKPLAALATQVSGISVDRLDERLALPQAASELAPWIAQFNGLMDRLQRAVAQLEAFNADVAHELRTPIATLIGETEVALSRERSPAVLRDTLVSNLEEMQRLSALVNDMLFLATADRGAQARRGAPVSLAALASEVAEFHEAAFEEAGLHLKVEGDATLAVDEPLVKRALSNLLGNAARFAEHGSTVQLCIEAEQAPSAVRVEVRNAGAAIEAEHLPRLFDRFFRADASRCCPDEGEQHHGLGLAIVAAIARMHAGRTLAECAGGTTRVGFTLAAH